MADTLTDRIKAAIERQNERLLKDGTPAARIQLVGFWASTIADALAPRSWQRGEMVPSDVVVAFHDHMGDVELYDPRGDRCDPFDEDCADDCSCREYGNGIADRVYEVVLPIAPEADEDDEED